jgi:hypothetical protein
MSSNASWDQQAATLIRNAVTRDGDVIMMEIMRNGEKSIHILMV